MPASNLPRKFWVITIIMLVWNILGVVAFTIDFTMSAEALAALPETQRALYENVPAWATVAYAVAVICGTLGCIALLVRKAVAVPLFVISFAAVLLQFGYAFLGSDLLQVMGPASIAMPAVITAVAVFLIWFSMSAKGRNWIA